MVLPYEELIISDLLEDPAGGLVVLSSGLPLQTLIASLLLLHSPSSGTLLLLSASESQKTLIIRSLSLHPSPLPSDVPGDLPSHHRSSLYSSGAALFVTPRILIADLLTSRCPPSAIAGLIILNAHRLSETSTEAFIARILRGANRSAYIRAFTDRPQAMVSGFAKAERIMKCLYIRKLHLWPRFHVQVSADLEGTPPEVVDVRVPMTVAMKGVQVAVLGAMDACLKELRRTNKVDVDDLTVENGLFKSFDEIVRRQLDPIWHTLGRKTRQLVYDLGTLRKLADYLVRYDAVTYLKYLDTLRASEGVRSIWVFADSSHKVFEFAKKRVYRMLYSDGSTFSSSSKSTKNVKKRGKEESRRTLPNSKDADASAAVLLDEVLEEAPKWKVLRELLEEIEEERHNRIVEDEHSISDLCNANDIVLVACKDERSCMQLEDCILKGSKQVMREEWEKYLLGKAELLSLQKRKKHKTQGPKGFGVLNGEVPAGSGENVRATSINKLENDALLVVASRISTLTGDEIVDGSKSESANGRAKKQKGKRLKGTAAQVSETKHKSKSVNNSRSEVPSRISDGLDDSLESESTAVQDDTHGGEPFLQKHNDEHGNSNLDQGKPLPPLQFCALDSDQCILSELKPSVIIVYHPNMTFVREIEVYKAENPLRKLRVYFLFYEVSTEVQKFEASIRRENAAFESLIRQKSLMIIPVNQDGCLTGSISSNSLHTLAPQNSVTRKAGGRRVEEREMQVIVDMREFMSSLPNVLHQKGMRIIPVVLEVGDYVLSPLICVERKSVSDLFQSFSSGRLYHQVETMSRYYQIPVLLIEFSQDKSFSFLSASDISDDVSLSSIISKLSLLVLHFPRLRLVWSRSVHATAEIFTSLKSNQDEPDEVKALRVGVPSEDGIVENDVRAENYNTTAVEFLRRLPGVTDSNYRALMEGCKSLADLALLPTEKLAELMGGQKAARTLREFLDAKCPTIL